MRAQTTTSFSVRGRLKLTLPKKTNPTFLFLKHWVTMIRFCIEKAEQARGTERLGLFSLEESVLACL